MKSFKLLEEETTGDFAFEATASTLTELFEIAGLATMTAMVDTKKLGPSENTIKFSVSAKTLSLLLYEYLTEIIFIKDVDYVFFTKFDVAIEYSNNIYSLVCKGKTTPINPSTQTHYSDVKAVTMHNLVIEKRDGVWYCKVILDI